MIGTHMPGSSDLYHYEGSLTTPGCDEVINWYVLKEPISAPGLSYFKNLWQKDPHANPQVNGGNNRNLQPLGARQIYNGTMTISTNGLSRFFSLSFFLIGLTGIVSM